MPAMNRLRYQDLIDEGDSFSVTLDSTRFGGQRNGNLLYSRWRDREMEV